MFQGNPSRRHFMKHMAGAAAVAVPGISFVQQLRAVETAAKKQEKSLVIFWMGGGPTTIDLWDMKPGTANGGEHKPAKTAVSGIEISEYLPTIGKQMKNLSIVRSLTTTEGDHMRGTTLMNTGRSPNPLIDYPHIGSVVSVKNASKDAALPSFISVGGTAERVGPGFLGMTYAPFTIQQPGTMPENIAPPSGVGDLRMGRRSKIFASLESGFSTKSASPDSARSHADVYAKAMKLSGSSGKEVFTFSSKDNADLGRYGQTGIGRGALMAKKLVEAGAVCVEVDFGGWDNHQGIFPTLATRLPQLDRAMGSLVEDLAQSGRLKNTVVVWMGEFGRTPRINQNAGRDHWARCWSVVLGGGDIKGGIAYGSTNTDGTEVKDNPVKIDSLYATIYKGLGIDPGHETNASLRDNLGRPFNIAGEGAVPVKELLV